VDRVLSLLLLGLFLLSLTACGGSEDRSTVTVTASLTWNPPVNHDSAVSYTVHYGKQSPEEGGGCHYEHSLDVSEPFATITGLEPDTDYYFAVSAYDGYYRSFCSNEVTKVSPKKKKEKKTDEGKPCKDKSDGTKCDPENTHFPF
jgi:Fibronectin type III domain